MSRGTRLPAIAPGIYPDALGYEARITVKGKPHSKRFPPNHPLELMQAWQNDERAYQLRCLADDDATRGTVARGTLDGDLLAYLKTREGHSGYKADRSHLHAWSGTYGTLPRHKLTKRICELQIATWKKAGVAPKTIRHRMRVLKELWHWCDGARARTPLDGVKMPRVPKTIPVPVDDAVILAVWESLKRGLTIQKRCGPTRKLVTVRCPTPPETCARFWIRALTGQRPSMIGRAKPEHIDRMNRVWWVQAGKGGNPVPFPLTDELEIAFAYFDQVGAWGTFDPCSFADTLRRHGWPKGVTPYRLRHSFAIAQLLAGTTLDDVQGLLGHTNPNTTRMYAPVLVSRLKSAVERRPLKLVR